VGYEKLRFSTTMHAAIAYLYSKPSDMYQ